MAYVDVSKRLSHPQKCGRIWYVTEPFVPKFWPKAGGSIYKQKDLEEYFGRAKVYSADLRVVAPLKSYRLHHSDLVEELPKIKHLRFIFIPGISPDLNEVRPGYVGHDIFSERFRLSWDILRIINNLDCYLAETNDSLRDRLENFCFMAVSPFVLSIGKVERCENKEPGNQLYLKHPLEHIFHHINKLLVKDGKAPIGLEYILTEKKLDQNIEGQKGMSEFSDFLYNSNAAKKIFINYERWPVEKIAEREKDIGYSIYLNRQMLAAQWGRIFGLLGISGPTSFIKKTSWAYESIAEFSGYEIDLVGGEDGSLKNMPISPLAECHPSALRFLMGRIKYEVCHGAG